MADILNELTDCPICLDHYEDPKMLPCQHIFCLNCLKQVPFEVRGKYILRCPICREAATIPNGDFSQIRTAFIINRILEVKRQDTPIITCPDHSDKQLDMYCNDCDSLICQRCLTRQHRGHVADFIEEVYDIFMQPLQQIMADVERQAEDIDKEIQGLAKEKQASIEACQKARKQVDEAANIMQKKVEEERRRLFKEIDEIEENTDVILTRKQRIAVKLKKGLKEANDSVKEHLQQSDSKPAVMASRDNTIKHMKSITTTAMKRMVEVKQESLEISFTLNESADFKLGKLDTNVPPRAPKRRQSIRKKPIDLKV